MPMPRPKQEFTWYCKKQRHRIARHSTALPHTVNILQAVAYGQVGCPCQGQSRTLNHRRKQRHGVARHSDSLARAVNILQQGVWTSRMPRPEPEHKFILYRKR
eukprot:jgi/Botrbrau1/9786/Bobra.85_1s0030.1